MSGKVWERGYIPCTVFYFKSNFRESQAWGYTIPLGRAYHEYKIIQGGGGLQLGLGNFRAPQPPPSPPALLYEILIHSNTIPPLSPTPKQMSKLVLPKMLKKKRGVIVNISSSAGDAIPPMLVVYGATKVTFIIHYIS